MGSQRRSLRATVATSAGALFALSLAGVASAGVTIYSGAAGWQSWQQAAGGFTTIDFTDLGQWEPVASDRYASSGVLVTDWDGNVGETNTLAFPLDNHGLFGYCVIEFTFTSPMQAVSMHFPGGINAWLYAGDTLLGYVQNGGGSGVNFFLGFTSDVAFDRIVLRDFSMPPPFPCNEVHIDNLYFSAVPSPGVLAALALGASLTGRRRRRN